MKKIQLVPVLGVLLVLFPAPDEAQPTPRQQICMSVFGSGELTVHEWMDDEPFLIAGEFKVAFDTLANIVSYLDTDPEQLDWYDGRFSLVALPGSDAPLPGDLSWSPCDSTWLLTRPGKVIMMTSFCESTMVPDGGVFEFFVREEVASIMKIGTNLNCGRLHVNGTWDPEATGEAPHGKDVTVSGKLCQCGPLMGRFLGDLATQDQEP